MSLRSAVYGIFLWLSIVRLTSGSIHVVAKHRCRRLFAQNGVTCRITAYLSYTEETPFDLYYEYRGIHFLRLSSFQAREALVGQSLGSGGVTAYSSMVSQPEFYPRHTSKALSSIGSYVRLMTTPMRPFSVLYQSHLKKASVIVSSTSRNLKNVIFSRERKIR